MALLLLVTASCGQADPAPERGAAVATILAEFPRLREEFIAGYSAAHTAGKTREYLAEHRSPDPVEFIRRLWPYVESTPDDAPAFLALRWIAEHGVLEDRARALALLGQHHLEDAGLRELLPELENDASQEMLDFLARCLDESPHHEVRGRACFALARAKHELVNRIGRAQSAHLDRPQKNGEARSMSSPEGVRYAALDHAAVREETARLYERAGGEFGDVLIESATLAELVKPYLHEVRHLEVGCEAPDILGEDIDGVPFKLSDYRGKVVLLNFWGFW